MNYSDAQIWGLIIVIGIGTYLIRFSFLGAIGDRPLPPVVLKLLRYTPVAVIPGLVAPLVLGSGDTAGDPARLLAAAATLLVGWRTKNLLIAIGVGVVVFYGVGYLSTP